MLLTCPKCQGQMRQYERSGVVVDQCTECRGIFLDRGELERLVDAENSWHGNQPTPPPAAPTPAPQPQPSYGYERGYQQGYGKPAKKRKSFLEDLFD